MCGSLFVAATVFSCAQLFWLCIICVSEGHHLHSSVQNSDFHGIVVGVLTHCHDLMGLITLQVIIDVNSNTSAFFYHYKMHAVKTSYAHVILYVIDVM